MWIKRRFSRSEIGFYPTKEKTKRRRIRARLLSRERETKRTDDFFVHNRLVFDDAFSFRLVLMSWLLSA